MNAGRELDALVAEKVMGETVVETDDCNGADNFWLARPTYERWEWPALPRYSTDIAAAWEVVEKLNAKRTEINRKEDDWWEVGLCVENPVSTEWDWHFATESTAPHAICLAALKAVGVAGG